MDDYLRFAKDVALEAGEMMLKVFKQGVETREKKDQSLVTAADIEINQFVIFQVMQKFPMHSVIGEESSAIKPSDWVWICDPIDGTTQFSKGVPVGVFSLALMKNGQPLVAVVYDPFLKRMYTAVKDRGAFMNEMPIKVSDKKLDHTAVVETDWWANAEYDFMPQIHDLAKEKKFYTLSIASVIHGGCLVAAGQYEAVVFAGTKGKNVDVAPLKLIVEEAGGKVTDLFGDDQRYDQDIKGAVISNGVVHEEILAATSKLN